MEDDHTPEETLDQECREPTLSDLVELCGWLNAEQARYVVVGGFAIRAAGYNRRTMDVDLLVETGAENEARVHRALERLPDHAIREVTIGEVAAHTVVRVADEYMVDLMRSGCGVTYADASRDVVVKEVDGTRIPFASPATLWKMKQTVRQKDALDRLFLRKWAEDHNVKLDPPPAPPAEEVPPWVEKLIGRLRRVFRKR